MDANGARAPHPAFYTNPFASARPKHPNSPTWAGPLPGDMSSGNEQVQDADIDEEDIDEIKFLDRRFVMDEGLGIHIWKIIPAGSAPAPEPPKPTTNEYAKYPLVLISDYGSVDTKANNKRLQVNSPALKAVIRRCLGDRHTKWKVNKTDVVEILWPWQDWFRGLDYFKKESSRLSEKMAEQTNQGDPIEQRLIRENKTCKLLVETIEKYHETTLNEMNECIPQGDVTYSLLWTLFDTFHEIYTEESNTSRVYEFVSGEYTCNDLFGPHYSVSCRYIDYDGENFGWVDGNFPILQFNGRSKIVDLRIYPLTYHPEKEKIREKLIARGRKFESLRGIHCMEYRPSLQGTEVDTVPHRLMIDARESASNHSMGHNPVFRPPPFGLRKVDLDENSYGVMRVVKEVGYCLSSEKSENTTHKRKYTELKENDIDEGEKPHTPLPDFYCLLTTNIVRGFDLKSKYWEEVDVMRLKEPTWHPNAFDSLVIDEDKKDLIKALVEQHIEDSSRQNTFDDFIPGKGKGLIYVLHGPPGVGKTLTAEAVSEYTKSPLYVVSAGQLGTKSSHIEACLNSAFRLCARWNALMLLDEADVFMETRSLHEMDRNAAVSVFLKVLEYYKGILFLTTNRVVSFDEAFKSRVHIALRFDELDYSSRLKIWESFIHKIIANGVEVDISAEELAKLAMKTINGREIKNAVKLAQSLTRKRGGPLKLQTLLRVVEIQEAFVGDAQKN